MIYGYARVSTKSQNLELQLSALEKYGCDKIYAEKVTGDYRKRKNKREELDKLFSVICKGDTLVVWKLDRLSRSLFETVTILETLLQREINFVSISDSFDTTSSYGKALLYIAAVFAQLEVDLIRERTLEGLEAARAAGRHGGRQRVSKYIQSKMYQMYYSGDYTIRQICKECGISQTTLYSYLNEYKENPDTLPELLAFEPIQIKKDEEIRNAGRPTIDKVLIDQIRVLHNELNYSITEIMKITGLSRTTVTKYCKITGTEVENDDRQTKRKL